MSRPEEDTNTVVIHYFFIFCILQTGKTKNKRRISIVMIFEAFIFSTFTETFKMILEL